MSERITVLVPYAEAVKPVADTPGPAHLRKDSLRGATVAFLSNRWSSMDIMAQRMEARLKEEWGVATVVQRDTQVASQTPPELIREVVEMADAVIVGLGN